MCDCVFCHAYVPSFPELSEIVQNKILQLLPHPKKEKEKKKLHHGASHWHKYDISHTIRHLADALNPERFTIGISKRKYNVEHCIHIV